MVKIKEPKDLGIKIGTPIEALWTKVLKEAKMLIKSSEDNLIIQRELEKLAEAKIKEQQDL